MVGMKRRVHFKDPVIARKKDSNSSEEEDYPLHGRADSIAFQEWRNALCLAANAREALACPYKARAFATKHYNVLFTIMCIIMCYYTCTDVDFTWSVPLLTGVSSTRMKWLLFNGNPKFSMDGLKIHLVLQRPAIFMGRNYNDTLFAFGPL